MASLSNIQNSTWGLSIVGYGAIVQGIALIRQSINIILRTSKGSDPLRPAFGSDIFEYIDLPISVSIPNIKKSIIESLELWEPRIKVEKITHSLIEPHRPLFEINYTVVDDGIIDKILFDARTGLSTTPTINEIILQAFLPPNSKGYRYGVQLIRNSIQVNPLPDPSGFQTISQLFEWAKANWFFWGRWYLLSDRIACYMNAEGVKNASLSISVLALTKIEAVFPQLSPGQFYRVIFKVNAIDVIPVMPKSLITPGEAYYFAQQNWGAYGEWKIEGVLGASQSAFSDEFGFEFDVIPDSFKLVLTTNIPEFNGELFISTAE